MKAIGKLVGGLLVAMAVVWFVDHHLLPIHPQDIRWSIGGIFQLDVAAVLVVLAGLVITKLWHMAIAVPVPGANPHSIGLVDIALVLVTIFASVVAVAAAVAIAQKMGVRVPQ